MKTTAWFLLMAFLLVALAASAEAPRLLNVQGVLTDNAGVVLPDDTYTITFRLYDVPTDGASLYYTYRSVTQVGGVFSVVLGENEPIDPGLFAGDLYLAMQFTEDTEMEPRIRLTGAPFALRASSVDPGAIGPAEIAPSTVVRSINGMRDNFSLVAGANVTITQVDTSLVIEATGGSGGDDGDWVIMGDDLYHYDGSVYLQSTPGAATAGEFERDGDGDMRDPATSKLSVHAFNEGLFSTMIEDNNLTEGRAAVFGKRTRTSANPGTGFGVYDSNAGVTGYNLWGDSYTWGVSGYTWFDAAHTAGIFASDNTTAYWAALAYRDGLSNLWGLYTPNSVHIGGMAEVSTLRVQQGAQSGYILTSDAAGTASWQPPSAVGSDGDWTISGANLYRDYSGTVAIGTSTPGPLLSESQATLQIEATVWPALVLDSTYGGLSRWAIINEGQNDDLWIGHTDQTGVIPTPLLVMSDNEVQVIDGVGSTKIRLHAESSMETGGVIYVFGDSDSQVNLALDGKNGNYGGGQVRIHNNTGAQTVVLTGDHNGTGLGRVQTSVLEITGGADLSEQFDVGENGSTVEPGMVVSIDPKRPGRLTLSNQAFDHRVAGVVSGAGGVKTGMLMGQRGSVADGELPVALAGRVYVWADATSGPIEPGDLLTTSAHPGHAMRVADPTRASGAILGKAMTGLSEGRGLVLVLVSLQ